MDAHLDVDVLPMGCIAYPVVIVVECVTTRLMLILKMMKTEDLTCYDILQRTIDIIQPCELGSNFYKSISVKSKPFYFVIRPLYCHQQVMNCV